MGQAPLGAPALGRGVQSLYRRQRGVLARAPAAARERSAPLPARTVPATLRAAPLPRLLVAPAEPSVCAPSLLFAVKLASLGFRARWGPVSRVLQSLPRTRSPRGLWRSHPGRGSDSPGRSLPLGDSSSPAQSFFSMPPLLLALPAHRARLLAVARTSLRSATAGATASPACAPGQPPLSSSSLCSCHPRRASTPSAAARWLALSCSA